MNIGGRPLFSWPAFIIPAYETTILFAAFGAVFGMLALNGLPQPYHPGVQRAELRPGQPRPLLHLHRGARPEVRSRGHPEVLRRRRRQGGERGGALMPTPELATAIRVARPRSSGVLSPFVRLVSVVSLVLVSLGCRQDMHDQPKLKPLAKSDFFADGRASRPQVEGTVARGQLEDESPFYTGKIDGQLSHDLPVPAHSGAAGDGTAALRDLLHALPRPHRQRRRHGRAARLQGAPARSTSDRLRAGARGYFFDVITNGFGAMPDYARPGLASRTAGPSSPTSARCSSARTPGRRTCPRNGAPRSTPRRSRRARRRPPLRKRRNIDAMTIARPLPMPSATLDRFQRLATGAAALGLGLTLLLGFFDPAASSSAAGSSPSCSGAGSPSAACPSP